MLYTNKMNIPLSMAVWLANDEYDYHRDPRAVSATTLLKPMRSVILARQHKGLLKGIDVSEQIPARMGTALHDSISKTWTQDKLSYLLEKLGYSPKVIERVRINPTTEDLETIPELIPVYIEQRFDKEIDGFIITGQADFIGEGIPEDFKSTSTYKYTKDSNDDDYRLQLSIYRWLRPEIITKGFGYIRFIFTDWSAAKAIYEKGYPPQKLASKKIQLLSVEETEQFIRGKLNQIRQLTNAPQADLPQCTPEELWQSADQWKYYKNPEKQQRATANCESAAEAYEKYNKDGQVGLVKHIPGQVKRCQYCVVRDICHQAQSYIQTGVLKLK